MKIKNINRVITTNGDTSDIINVVMYAYEVENDPQIYDLAKKLQGATVYDTCRNIFQYLIDNVHYRADGDGNAGELIRTPARLLVDGTGDCKSYSLFTAVILRYLKIPHVFRFASYSQRKEATHVYIVANPGTRNAEREIIIDAVAHVQLGYGFNKEAKYTYKCDMANGGTKISYLAGLPGVGRSVGSLDVNSDERYAVWTGNENITDITHGKAWLYGRYDLLNEMINISKSKRETLNLYKELSIIAALIYVYNYVNGNSSKFDKYSQIICGLIASGEFKPYTVEPDILDRWFENILIKIINFEAKGFIHSKIDKVWYNTIVNNVLTKNRQQSNSVSGVGSFNPLADGLKKAGIYFIYTFIPESELKNYPDAVSKKRSGQIFFRNAITVLTGHSTAWIMDTFRAGIIARTGMQPEVYIAKVKAENIKSIGFAEIFITISSIIGIILGLLEIIKAIWPNSKVANYSVSANAPDLQKELFTGKKSGTGMGTDTGKSLSGTGIILGLSLGVTFLLSKFKNH